MHNMTTTTKRANATKRATPAKRASAIDTSVTLTSMCAEHNRDPKIIRAKARRIRDQLAPHLFPATSDERWAFKSSSVATVTALLFKRA
jgi:hypothetical protein